MLLRFSSNMMFGPNFTEELTVESEHFKITYVPGYAPDSEEFEKSKLLSWTTVKGENRDMEI